MKNKVIITFFGKYWRMNHNIFEKYVNYVKKNLVLLFMLIVLVFCLFSGLTESGEALAAIAIGAFGGVFSSSIFKN